MTLEEYNLYRFFIDIIMALISLIIGASSGIYIENRWKVSSKFKWYTKRSNKQQIKQNGDNNQAAISKDGNATNFNIGSVNIIRTKQEALKQPFINDSSLQLSDDAQFICREFTERFRDKGEVFGLMKEYVKAEDYKKNKNFRASATIYIKIFSPLIDFIRRHYNDDNIAREIEKQVQLLKSWSIEGDGDNFEDTIRNIESILFSFLQK